ncbi:MAG: RidA family protein [Xanthobacteraceae bacterium]
MAKEVIYTDKLMRPIAHFSHASRVGDLVHVGATAGVFPGLRLAGESPGTIDIVAQTNKMFENLETTLELMGVRLNDVVRLKTYIISPRDVGKYLEIYRKRFAKIAPAHTIVASWDFPLPQAAIELDAIAVVNGETENLLAPGLFQAAAEAAAGVMVDGTHYATALPIDAQGKAVGGNMLVQAKKVLENLATMLKAAGLRAKDVCNIHMTIADMRDLDAANAILCDWFGGELPSISIVSALLSDAAFKLAVESVAVRGGGKRIASKALPLQKNLPAPGVLAGDVLYLSGYCSTEGSVEQQTRMAWQNHLEVIAAAGFNVESILRSNNVLVDWRDYAGFNAGYGANIPEPYVPRATVLGQLRDSAARVQVECLAHRDGANAKILQVAPLAPRQP